MATVGYILVAIMLSGEVFIPKNLPNYFDSLEHCIDAGNTFKKYNEIDHMLCIPVNVGGSLT